MGEQEIMEQAITGSILIADDQYPYSYDKETEKLTLYIGGKTISVPEDTMSFVGQKYGVLNGGRFLYKLDLPFSNDCMGFENGQPKYFPSPIKCDLLNTILRIMRPVADTKKCVSDSQNWTILFRLVAG